MLTTVLLTLAFFTGGVLANFSSSRSRGRRSALAAVGIAEAAADGNPPMPEVKEGVRREGVAREALRWRNAAKGSSLGES